MLKTDTKVCREPVQIPGIGARTVFGETLKPSVTAIRAGLRGFKQHPYLIGKTGHNVVVAADRLMDIDTCLQDRLVEMAVGAILEALLPITKNAQVPPVIALIVGTPEKSGAKKGIDYKYFGESLIHAIEKIAVLYEVQLIHHGHASGIEAISEAQKLLQEGRVDYCVAGGVDSCIDSDAIDYFDIQDRLNSKANGWGFVPGEAASFVLLGKVQNPRHGVQVISTAVALEENLINTNTVCTGEGLTQSLCAALESIDPEMEKIHNMYCDMNGERYRGDEFGFAMLRTRKWIESPDRFHSPAQTIGDIGAANAPLNIALAIEASFQKEVEGTLSIIWSSSDLGQRGALVLRAPLGQKV